MKLSTAIPLASAVALALLCASPVAVRAQTPTKTPTSARVVKLRLENVSLCKLPNGTDCTTYSRAQFKDPWPILGQSAQGLLQVQVGAAKLWVRGYAVETDVRFSVPADCGAVVAGKQRASGATRGLVAKPREIGEECVPESKK